MTPASRLVMVVDDDEALRESICELLEEDGFRTVWADSGATALTQLRGASERPNVILLDLMMPVMNGWQFREAQLGDPRLAAIPVVVMTARRDLQRIKADAVVHKPLKLAKLLEVLGRFVSPTARTPSARPPALVAPAPAEDLQALRQSEERFRFIFESAEVSIWDEDFSQVRERLEPLRALHGDGLPRYLESNPQIVDELRQLVRVHDVNPATLRMFGAASKEQLLASLRQVRTPESRPMFAQLLLALAAGAPNFAGECTYQRLDGHPFEVAVRASFPPGDRVLVTLMDVSSRPAGDERRGPESERAPRFSEAFVGVLGHDLRNPLSAITTAASLLEVRAESEKIARPVARILVSAERMERMISQLLDFTRVRLGSGIPLSRAPSDLAEIALSVIEELQPVHGRHIQLESQGDPSGSWDRERLAQLLGSLVSNACRHGIAGTPVGLRVDGSAPEVVRLEVKNRGAVPPHLLPVVFEPLRLSRGEGREEGRREGERPERREGSSGLGLGLYITQQIALAHGGTIQVHSDDADGTCFTVELPRHGLPE